MQQVSQDFRAEVDELHAFAKTLPAGAWERETGFMAWTPWDVVAHLHYFDLVSLVAVEGEEAFAAESKALLEALSAGATGQQLARERFAGMGPADLMRAWQSSAHRLADGLGALDPKSRLPWFGPSMGVSMFTTARLMETWAHGQEIYDLVGATRADTDRLKHVATIGVKTFGWTFANRGLEVPGAPPYVRLSAPSGAAWEWNEPSESECVRGSAGEFCQVVTQVRNVADTRLEVRGPVATRWMEIAQCFAGGPVDPPAPGVRGPA